MSKPITSRKAAIAYNDIDALAQHVAGFDAVHYFDQQGDVETAQAAHRWPLLARAMGLPAVAATLPGALPAVPADAAPPASPSLPGRSA